MDRGGEELVNAFREAASHTTPAEALQDMGRAGAEYCVIFDDDSTPVSLMAREDVERAKEAGAPRLLDPKAAPPPTIFVPEGVPVEELAADPVITLLEYGARGAIVIGQGQVKAILPAGRILYTLGSGQISPTVREMGSSVSTGDLQLGGRTNTPRGKIVCAQCGYSNEVRFLDEERLPQCQTPQGPGHTLKIR